jgi:pilus assembly protein CpaB
MATRSRRIRSQLIFILVFIFAAAVAALSWWTIEQVREQARQDAGLLSEQQERVSVVVATQDIPARTEITSEMVALVEKARGDLPPQAVRNLGDVIGATSRQRIPKDDEIHFTKLFAQRAEAGLAFIVPEGMRAVSVSVNESIGSGGLILPGDYVDVISICRAGVEGGNEPGPNGATIKYEDVVRSTFALQSVEVLAVGQLIAFEEPPLEGVEQAGRQLLPARQDQISTVKPPAQPSARTVTFAVAPEDAQSLILYDDLCDLRLALRRPGEKDELQTQPKLLTFGTAR